MIFSIDHMSLFYHLKGYSIPRAVTIVVFCCLLPIAVVAESNCTQQARTDLEKLFCNIQASSEGRALPSFSDFRRNSPKVQQALLKSPARRLGLSLPKIPVASRTPPRNTQNNDMPEAVSEKKSSKSENLSQSSVSVQNRSPIENSGLVGCQLSVDIIACGSHRYRLISNLSNKKLRSGALGELNKMQMLPFNGNANDTNGVKSYLVDAYLQYIEKMLDIGLGASTMSFTKFYYTFYDLQEKNQNFSERFEKMYGFLKKDKASMAIKSRYTDAKPSSLSQCSALSRKIIVCDQKEINWVFVRE